MRTVHVCGTVKLADALMLPPGLGNARGVENVSALLALGGYTLPNARSARTYPSQSGTDRRRLARLIRHGGITRVVRRSSEFG